MLNVFILLKNTIIHKKYFNCKIITKQLLNKKALTDRQ